MTLPKEAHPIASGLKAAQERKVSTPSTDENPFANSLIS
jgi:hypothetical protein